MGVPYDVAVASSPPDPGALPTDAAGAVYRRHMTGLLFIVAKTFRQAVGERVRNESWLVQVGFRPPCIGALMTLASGDPVSQRELATLMGIDPSDLVGVVDILEAAGFVSRERDPADRRRRLLAVTADGRKAVRRLHDLMAEVDDEVMRPLDDDQRQQLHTLLAEIVAHRITTATTAATDPSR
jgi:DNA-binding MarR family transcriptional regulator